MSNYFINYDADTGHLSINTFRKKGYDNSGILDLVSDIYVGWSGSCPLDGAKDALEEYEHIINQIRNLIQEHEAEV